MGTLVAQDASRPADAVKTGRPQSIHAWAWPEVFRLREQGLGYRMVATRLADLEVWTTRGSVERLIKGRPPYQDRRPSK